jgi:hypothetical protein
MTNLHENWLPINGYLGAYEVSDLGRVRTVERFIPNRYGFRRLSPIIRKQRKDKGGYLIVDLRFDMGIECKKVHRLVAEAFIPNPKNLKEVNHIDHNKENNCVNNLQWVTRSQNVAHTVENKKHSYGEKQWQSILKEYQILEIIELRKLGKTHKQIAEIYNVSRGTITSIFVGRNWKHLTLPST